MTPERGFWLAVFVIAGFIAWGAVLLATGRG